MSASFGEWVKARRAALGLSRPELAARVGCAAITIRKIEADERRPSAQVAELLAQHLGLPAEARAAFVRAARAELAADRLPPPAQLGQAAPAVHLPAARTPLIGRAPEAAALRDRLLRDDTSLLTLTGPPGVGKTRLALHVAEAAAGAFADGACFVALAPLSDPALVASAIAQALGAQATRSQTPPEALAAFLRHKQILLVIDNFEQVIGAAPLLADLLAAAPGLKVLATSRAALRLSLEHEFPVPPLALPDLHDLPPADALAQNAAVELFVQRARAVQPDFVLSAHEAATVAEICHRLDGLPLAIELAAARSKLFAPAALLARLSSRLQILTNGRRDVPERHQTLQNAIAWSYDLLEAPEQALFRRLGVFVGGFTLEGAEAVCRGWELGDGARRVVTADPTPTSQPLTPILDKLAALVDKSLLRQVGADDGEPRFEMLETIREYALDRLSAHGEAACQRRRHAEIMLALAERAEPLLQGGQQAAWLNRLETEHDNLRAALSWSLEEEQASESTPPGAPARAEIGLRLAGALWLFWQVRSYYAEGSAWLCRAVEQAPAPTPARAKALNGAGFLLYNQYEYAASAPLLAESIALARALGERATLAHALNNLGTLLIDQRELAEGLAYCEQSLALARELGIVWLSGWALLNMSRVAGELHRLHHALDLCEQGLALFRSIDGQRGMAFALMFASFLTLQLGDVARAAALLEEALALCHQLKDQHGIMYVSTDLARILRARSGGARAAALVAESLALAREQNNALGLAWAVALRGCLLGDQGQHTQAYGWLADGLARARGLREHELSCLVLARLAQAYLAQSQPEQAARLLGAREQLREQTSTLVLTMDVADAGAAADAARAALPPDRFAAAWAAGRAAPIDELIAGLPELH